MVQTRSNTKITIYNSMLSRREHWVKKQNLVFRGTYTIQNKREYYSCLWDHYYIHPANKQMFTKCINWCYFTTICEALNYNKHNVVQWLQKQLGETVHCKLKLFTLHIHGNMLAKSIPSLARTYLGAGSSTPQTLTCEHIKQLFEKYCALHIT